MHMGLFSRLKDPRNGAATTGDYIDLEEYAAEAGMEGGANDPDAMYVRVAEIRKYDELRELAAYVYKGNMLILDFAPIQNEEIILKRVTGELKKLVADIGGDIAGLGKTTLLITPTSVRIDRTKYRAK
jgi:uncharacterized protein